MAKEGMKLVANNKKAFHAYFIEEKFECGLVLHGTEVKSLRMGKCSIKEAYIRIENGDITFDFISPLENVKNIELGQPIPINIENGIAAMAMAQLNGCTAEELRYGMQTYRYVNWEVSTEPLKTAEAAANAAAWAAE